MKYLILILAFVVYSCAGESTQKTPAPTTESSEEVTLSGTKQINLKESTIFWNGHKLMGAHSGKIGLQQASISFEKGNISGGDFVVDMHSITVTELMDDDDDEEEEEEEEEGHDDKADLASHLMNEDFFDADKFPTASFVIKQSRKEESKYIITGDMTIKGITKEITFDAQLAGDTITSTIEVDRTAFGIKYGSGSFFDNLGDRVIKDKFDLILSLKIVM